MVLDLTTQAGAVRTSSTDSFWFSVAGLLPNTKHNFYLDGIDHSSVCRQWGKAPGEDLVSDSDGEITFMLHYDMPFDRDENFELPQGQTLSFQETIFNETPNQNLAVLNSTKLAELKSANENSYWQETIRFDTLLTAGPADTNFPIE